MAESRCELRALGASASARRVQWAVIRRIGWRARALLRRESARLRTGRKKANGQSRACAQTAYAAELAAHACSRPAAAVLVYDRFATNFRCLTYGMCRYAALAHGALRSRDGVDSLRSFALQRSSNARSPCASAMGLPPSPTSMAWRRLKN